MRGVRANVAYAESCTRDTRAQCAQREKRNELSRLARELMRRRVQCGGRRASSRGWPRVPPRVLLPSNRGILMRPSGEFMVTNVVH